MKYWLVLALLLSNLAYFLHSQYPWSGEEEKTHNPHKSAPVMALMSSGSGAAARAALCLQAGPFTERTSAEHVQQRLRAATVDSAVHQSEKRTPGSFQVYIPPLGGHRAAEQTLHRLRAKGVHGQLVTEGPIKDGIVLARFSRRSQAEQSALEYRKQGYTTAVQPVASPRNEYWVELNDSRSNLVSQSLWKSMLAPYGLTGPLQLPCHQKPADNGRDSSAEAVRKP